MSCMSFPGASSKFSSSSSSLQRVVTPNDLPAEILEEIASFLNGNECLKLLGLNTYFLGVIINAEILWRKECLRLEYQVNRGSKSRDKRSWLEVYKDNQCIECYDTGTISMNVYTYKGRPSFCIKCFNQVRNFKSFQDRKKYCLLNVKDDRTGRWHFARHHILNSIPTSKEKCNKPTGPEDVDFDGAFHNDYLLKKLPKTK